MIFTHNKFSCDVDVFRKENDILLRFYNRENEQSEDEIINLVIVDPGYGFLCLKVKGDSGLISGYLDESIFSSDEMVEDAVEFLNNLSPECKGGYVPFHVKRVKMSDFVEYNGEY